MYFNKVGKQRSGSPIKYTFHEGTTFHLDAFLAFDRGTVKVTFAFKSETKGFFLDQTIEKRLDRSGMPLFQGRKDVNDLVGGNR